MNEASEVSSGQGAQPCRHFLSALAALICVGVILATAQCYVRMLLPNKMAAFAERPSPIKLTGNILQTEAFCLDATLPIYGSSELDRPADNRPDAFFRTRPTGFTAFPIGRGGTTCLMILQKVAAVGTAARGRKAVIFLSPSWFLRDEVGENAVDANLTSPQLSAWSFGNALSWTLRQKIARRLLDYPESLEDQVLLAAAVHCMAEPTPAHRAAFAMLAPLGRMQNALFQRLEYCAILREMVRQSQAGRRVSDRIHRGPLPAPHDVSRPDWERLAGDAEAKDRAYNDGAFYSATNALLPPNRRAENIRAKPAGSRDGDFVAAILLSKEFSDLQLLVDVLRELGVDALFVSQPFNGLYRNLGGTTRRGRQVYYDKLAATMAHSGYPLLDFNDHEEDRFFFNDASHPSAKAWIFYDQGIDRFYHGTHG